MTSITRLKTFGAFLLVAVSGVAFVNWPSASPKTLDENILSLVTKVLQGDALSFRFVAKVFQLNATDFEEAPSVHFRNIQLRAAGFSGSTMDFFLEDLESGRFGKLVVRDIPQKTCLSRSDVATSMSNLSAKGPLPGTIGDSDDKYTQRYAGVSKIKWNMRASFSEEGCLSHLVLSYVSL